jgi:hypothetical protein
MENAIPGEQNENLRRKKEKEKNGTVFKQVVANSFVMFS